MQPGLFLQHRLVAAGPGLVVELLDPRQCVRRLGDEGLRELPRLGQWIVADPAHQPERLGLRRRQLASAHGQLHGGVHPHQVAHGDAAAHVGDDAPLDLHHRETAVGGAEAKVGAERNLQPAAKADPLGHGDHRHRQLVPAIGHPLDQVGGFIRLAF